MYYPKLKAPARKRYLLSRFGGYDHRPAPQNGSFYEMKNLSGRRSPHLAVRGKRIDVDELDGCPTQQVLAIGGTGTPVILDANGGLWCGGEVLPRFLGGTTRVQAAPEEGVTVHTLDQAQIVSLVPLDGSFPFVYDRDAELWRNAEEGFVLPDTVLNTEPQQDEGTVVTLTLSTTPPDLGERSLCFLGGWVCVFPDGRYANTVRLRQGATLAEGEDFGSVSLENRCGAGTVRFSPCGIDGTVWSVTESDTAPESGFWVDTSEPEPEMKCLSSSQGLWIAVNPYVKCEIPGIAKGVSAGDGVELFSRLVSEETDSGLAEDFWSGSHTVVAAWHDPGAAGRAEGTGDYIVLAGLLSREIELTLGAQEQRFLTLSRVLPEMDFVVSCQNRLWGCRYGGVNELYASKLGDFRNWSAFDGLSTDSWRVSRGQDGPFTGAAVLDGCPLFFRENGLEKVYPAAGGNHTVVTRSLCGIEAGSHKSAVVIRDRLYYNSPQGICRYSGTLPELVSGALGPEHWKNAVAGALGKLYYVFQELPHTERCLFVLDTGTGVWYKEDELPLVQFWSSGTALYYLSRPNGPLGCISADESSDGVDWYAETGDLFPVMGTRRYVSRLRITARLDPGAEMRVFLRCDGGPWVRKGSFFGNTTRSLTLPIWPRRCDRLQLRFEGSGGMELQQISFLAEPGSDE